MRIHLPMVVPPGVPSATATLRALAALDSAGAHTITEDAEDADLILFADCHVIDHAGRIDGIAHHPLRRRYPARCVVYDERDRPWCDLPGVRT